MKRFFLIFLLLQAALASVAAVKLTQQLDSAYLLMGKKTTLNIELLTDGEPNGQLVVDPRKFPAEVEATPGAIDTASLGNNRWQLRQQVVIQSFDSGMYVLPPIAYVARPGDTVRSNTLALKVVPVAVDSLTDIHDYTGVRDAGLRWFDHLPDWLVDWGLWVFLGLLIAGGALWAYMRYGRKAVGNIRQAVAVRRRPPYEEAIAQLNTLRGEHLCEQGHEKEFYTRLTEILRVYLQDRFGINAMEMTSSQILHSLDANEQTRLSKSAMRQVLTMADFVKFAKVRPLPDDNVASFNRALDFVESTKPEEQPQQPSTSTQTPSKE